MEIEAVGFDPELHFRVGEVRTSNKFSVVYDLELTNRLKERGIPDQPGHQCLEVACRGRHLTTLLKHLK